METILSLVVNGKNMIKKDLKNRLVIDLFENKRTC